MLEIAVAYLTCGILPRMTAVVNTIQRFGTRPVQPIRALLAIKKGTFDWRCPRPSILSTASSIGPGCGLVAFGRLIRKMYRPAPLRYIF